MLPKPGWITEDWLKGRWRTPSWHEFALKIYLKAFGSYANKGTRLYEANYNRVPQSIPIRAEIQPGFLTYQEDDCRLLRCRKEMMGWMVGKKSCWACSPLRTGLEPWFTVRKRWHWTFHGTDQSGVYLCLHLSDSLQGRLSFGQKDAREGGVGVATRDHKVKRERRVWRKPRPRHVDVVFRIHPESVQLWNAEMWLWITTLNTIKQRKTVKLPSLVVVSHQLKQCMP